MSSNNVAFEMVKVALDKTIPNASSSITMDTHLIDEKVMDSLDSMNFLFELEQLHGSQLTEITETFVDFRVSRLVEILNKAKGID